MSLCVVYFSKRFAFPTIAPFSHSRQGAAFLQPKPVECQASAKAPKLLRQRKRVGQEEVPAKHPSTLKALIRNKPAFLDEELAPDVDHKLLLALVRRELPEQTARSVYRFVHLFKSWNDAYCDALVREYRVVQGP